MGSMSDLFRAISRVVLISGQIDDLSARLAALEDKHQSTRERLVRIEAFIALVEPAVARRLDIANEPKKES